MLSTDARKRLLDLARLSMEAAVRREKLDLPAEDHPELQQEQGCFVTLKNHGKLRGCLGNFVGDASLWQMVTRMAQASATEDPRFMNDPITERELPEIAVEISVLSPMEKIADPLKIELGTHGIYVRNGMRTGCFLPQVAEETGWTKEEFLGYCCAHKAGLAADAWRYADTEVFVFTAEVFSENDE